MHSIIEYTIFILVIKIVMMYSNVEHQLADKRNQELEKIRKQLEEITALLKAIIGNQT